MNDYNSVKGRGESVIKRGNDFWGPATWTTLHTFALCYQPTPENRRAFLNLIESLQYLIPCKICRSHFIQNLAKIPLNNRLESSEDLFAWTVELHNLVNKQLGKPQVTLQWAEKYYHERLFSTKYGKKTENFSVEYMFN